MTDFYTRALSLAIERTSPVFSRTSTEPDLDSLFVSGSRMALGNFCWQMYRGDQLRFIPKLPGETALEYARRPHKTFLNITRVIIDVLSHLYRRPVRRRLDGSKPLIERVQRAWRSNPLGRLMQTCDRLTRLEGVAALRVSYQRGEVRYWPYPAHRMIVIPDSTQPDRPLAVIAFAAGESNDLSLAHIWTDERVATVSAGRVVEEAEHGLGRVPFTFFHDRLPVEDFWVEGRGRSIAHANASFNAKLSELAHTVVMQGFGVMEIVNPDPSQEIAIGPARAISFTVSNNEPFGVNFKSPNAPISELIQDLEFLLRTLLKTQRIPDSVLSVNVGASVSGVSVLAQQSPILEDRVERAMMFQDAEQDLLDCTLAVLREHEGLRGEARVQIDFPEPMLEQNASERLRVDEWQLRHSLVTPWELMLRDDPDGYENLEAARSAWLEKSRQNTETVND